jgi:hypothetical protein
MASIFFFPLGAAAASAFGSAFDLGFAFKVPLLCKWLVP